MIFDCTTCAFQNCSSSLEPCYICDRNYRYIPSQWAAKSEKCQPDRDAQLSATEFRKVFKELVEYEISGVFPVSPTEIVEIFDTAMVNTPVIKSIPESESEWIKHEDEWGLTYECGKCHIEGMMNSKFCYNCGSKMRNWREL